MITLPPNNFGLILFLISLILLAIVPFVLVIWLALFLAPWWVALPLALSASVLSLIFGVKWKNV